MLQPKTTPRAAAVAEVQGLYGPFTFAEKLLQQIWDRRDFDITSAVTADGRRLHIEHPGQWNHLGGPDFKDARLNINGVALIGDIELHLRETDWHAHQHATDPAYANVALHVVLFPPRNTQTTSANNRLIPILTLLPLLHHDLEQYAADDAIEHLAEHPLTNAAKNITSLPREELSATLAKHASQRWTQKIHYARLRIQRLGWTAACHHTALEILGYSRNRAAMLAVATAHPFESWHHATHHPAAFANKIYETQNAAGAWASQATRPANHPRVRLHQYAAWTSANPTWPDTLLHFLFPGSPDAKTQATFSSQTTVAAWRRARKATLLRKRICAEICANTLGGTRLDTLICDGFLPLLAAHTPADEAALSAMWHDWFAGDTPVRFSKQLCALEITGTRETPLHNGAIQGLLGMLLSAAPDR